MKNDKGQKVTLAAPDGRKVQVRLEINPRAKRVILRLDARCREGVAVAPAARFLAEAQAFATERAGWLADQLDEVATGVPFTEGTQFPLRGAPCRISGIGEGRLAWLEEGSDPLTLRAPGALETLSARVTRYLKKEARADLEAAVARHCETLSVRAARITVKDTRSRWGSCTSDGRLSFSWRLICAPPDVLDYVAAHECAHLIEMNHSRAFWALVEICRKDWKAQRAWLRMHGASLHAIGAD